MRIVFFVGLSISILSCSAPENPIGETTRSENPRDIPITKQAIAINASYPIFEEDYTEDDCYRGEPLPLLDSIYFKNVDFVLTDQNEAIETAILPSGDKIRIRNCGCEQVVVNFSFETSSEEHDLIDHLYWTNKAGSVLSQLNGHFNSEYNWNTGINALSSYYSKHNHGKAGEEIEFDTEGRDNFVSLDKVEKLSDQKYRIELTFAVEPL